LLDAAEPPLELLALAPELEHLFLGELGARAGLGELLELAQALDRLANRLEIREHPAEPALAHIRHAAALRLGPERLARGPFAADERQGAPVRHELAHELGRPLVQRQRLLEIDDMDLVALSEDELRHLRVPEAGLVPKMHARFQHPAHRHVGHGTSPLGLVLHAAPLTTPFPGHPVSGLTARVWCLTSRLRCL